MLSSGCGGEMAAATNGVVVGCCGSGSAGVVCDRSPCGEIYAALSGLMANGIEIDKNLRQPTFYSWIAYDELKIESFWIITDLLGNQLVLFCLITIE